MRLPGFVVALLPLALAACLSSTEPTTYATVEGTTFAPALGVDLANSTKTTSGLYYRDVIVGTGAAIALNDSVGVNYVGNLSNGVPFDSLKAGDTNSPLRFRVGKGFLIPGFEEGVIGMHVGGRRQLIIPPNLAFGLRAYFNIPGNSVVVFMVDAAAIF